MWRGAWDSYAPEYPCHAWWTIQQADSSSISSAYSRPPQGQNLIVINTSVPPEVPGVGFYPHNSIMTEPFPQPPSFVPPFSHALPALHVDNLPTAPLSSELHSTDSPIDQALNPDLTTYLDTATHHTVNIPNSATSGDLGQTEDVAPPLQQPLPPQVHHGPDDAGPDPGEERSESTALPNVNSATHQDNAATPTNTNKKQNRAYHTAADTPLLSAAQTSNTVTPEGNAPSVSSPLASSSTGLTSSLQTPHDTRSATRRQSVRSTPARAAGQSSKRGKGRLANKFQPTWQQGKPSQK